MSDVGYLRVSSTDQSEERQLDGVTLDKTFTDKASGGSKNRPALEQLREYVREGDTIHVHSIDRLARDLADLMSLLAEFTGQGVGVKFHKEKLTFTGEDNPFQTLQMQIVGAVAQFERSIIRERQREGIKRKKDADKELPLHKRTYKGRKPSIDAARVKAMKEEGKTPSAIAKELKIARSSVYRVLEDAASAA